MTWTTIDHTLYKKFVFRDFAACFSFMTHIALLAEQMQHHPTLTNTYNVLEVWLTTHDAGNTISEKDYQMAKAIDAIGGYKQ